MIQTCTIEIINIDFNTEYTKMIILTKFTTETTNLKFLSYLFTQFNNSKLILIKFLIIRTKIYLFDLSTHIP